MSFLDEVEKHFSTRCLYTALNVEKSADDKQLKKAYRLLSLKHHPDRADAGHKAVQTEVFQTLSRIHSILADNEKRAVYDETGDILDEEDSCVQDRDWDAYWRLMFKKITKEDILYFESEFKGSTDETEQLKKYYVQFEGDMDEILNHVMCSTVDDEDKFRETINALVQTNELPAFPAFTQVNEQKRKKRVRKAKIEEKEAEQHAKDLNLDTADSSSLEQLILQKHQNRGKQMNNIFDSLEAKYCKKPATKKNKGAGKTTASKPTKRKRK